MYRFVFAVVAPCLGPEAHVSAPMCIPHQMPTYFIGRIQSNPRMTGVKIALGGPAVNMYPEAFAGIGADIVARSALEVMQFADRIAA